MKCSTDDYKHANVLAPGDELTVHVHAANEVHISEVPAGTKSARLAAASAPIALPVIDPGTDSLEREIQAKADKAPRVKPDDVKAEIVGETFTLLPSGRVTVCELTLKNGFTVRGESAVVFIENFNEEIGRKVARENAEKEVWQLLGFRLRDKLSGGLT